MVIYVSKADFCRVLIFSVQSGCSSGRWNDAEGWVVPRPIRSQFVCLHCMDLNLYLIHSFLHFIRVFCLSSPPFTYCIVTCRIASPTSSSTCDPPNWVRLPLPSSYSITVGIRLQVNELHRPLGGVLSYSRIPNESDAFSWSPVERILFCQHYFAKPTPTLFWVDAIGSRLH